MKHRTKDGQVLEINKMTDSHLQNTIALHQRKLKPYLEEAKKRNISSNPPAFLKIWRWGKRSLFQMVKTKKCSVSGYSDLPFRDPIDGEETEEMYHSFMH